MKFTLDWYIIYITKSPLCPAKKLKHTDTLKELGDFTKWN
ncbi:hypothetical protein CLOSTASPAR_04414 [[Clostridium] asparagiforme DSM 15981]|uniref:Uncharacterized protein n=1 Tax=[Clostridium] asparagiforme DSM 15981 TaxID=518636 RepID=C0D568_9FIRM|nr:hypothetical protein CLOSTASPAR_04414 [[Clostridium] asparagiforme DSM 15981]